MANKSIIAIIYNPNAGQNRKKFLNRVLNLLESNNVKIKLFATEYSGHATEIAAALKSEEKYKMIIAAGGDGTINEVINGIQGSEKILGIIPIGTVSVLAKEIGLKLTPEAVVAALIEEKTKDIYPAIINGKYFSLMASVGVDAASVKNVNLSLKKKVSKMAYLFSFMREIFKTKFYSHSITIDDLQYESYCTIIAKGKLYAGEFICAPAASIHDQYLHVVMLKKKGILNLIKFFWAISRSRIESLKEVEIIKTKSLSIVSEHDEDVQIDGDYFGQLPVNIKSSEKSIRLLVPGV